jgi:hypothetical protein
MANAAERKDIEKIAQAKMIVPRLGAAIDSEASACIVKRNSDAEYVRPTFQIRNFCRLVGRFGKSFNTNTPTTGRT